MTALFQTLRITSGHISANSHPVPKLEFRNLFPDFGDDSDILMSEIGVLGSGDRLQRGVCAGGRCKKTDIRPAKSACNISDSHPILGRQRSVGQIFFVLDRINTGKKETFGHLRGRFSGEDTRDIFVKIDDFHFDPP